ncbi:uncharacterized protein LOC128551800 [Mercenaria mercenaria]|uniref:uncharacterized protein LOC128551800 n=1 Tax=Mercenaria mercenaria TaxID=6596 RepID=UPI00234E6367|nr:uncharacterized protein LOC128551800 [Mercenaria mercenaria]
MIKQTEKAMETIVRTDTHSITSTENNLQSTRNQLMAESTTSLNESKVQENEFEKQRKEENLSDLSVEVGLPVGVCMALIFGIILSIYLARRYKCLKRKTDCNQNNSREAQHPRSSKYSFGTAHAHFNASYEASEEIAIKKISNDDKKNVSENSNRNKQHHSDSNSEYAVVHKTIGGKTFNSDKNKQNLYCYSYGYKDNCASSNEVQTAEYSFAKETCTDEVYDVERCHTESDDYDVTGNILSCTSNISSNIYNQLQSNEYDSTASVSGNDCNHMYDITQNQRTESVYDSTNEVHNSTQCDNVYNQLSQATATSNQNN